MDYHLHGGQLDMPQVWQVRVKDQTGALSGVLTGQQDGFIGFSFNRTVNAPGSFLLLFMQRASETMTEFLARTAIFEQDGQVEFWRRHSSAGIDWQQEAEYLTLSRRIYTTVEGGTMMYIGGRGYLDLIGRRIIAAYTQSGEAYKTGPAESVIKEYVDEQAGPGAGARAIAGLTVEADAGGGIAGGPWGKQYQGLLDTIQEIRQDGGGDFDVVGTGAATFEFRWYEGQRGTDRTANVLFSLGRGNMGQPELNLAHQSEINAVLVGGQGEEQFRAWSWRTDDARIAASPWGRRERFRDARQEPDPAGLDALGDAFLVEGTPKELLTFKPLQVPGTLLGKDYFLGDLVTGSYAGYTTTKHVHSYTYTWNQDTQGVLVELTDA